MVKFLASTTESKSAGEYGGDRPALHSTMTPSGPVSFVFVPENSPRSKTRAESFTRLAMQLSSKHQPHPPDDFNAIVETKSFTNKVTDLPIVKKLYKDAFELRIPKARWLDFQYLGWGDAEAAAVSRALHAAKAVGSLMLNDNDIGSEGAAALAAALREGAGPELWGIDLNDNHIGIEGAAALAAALREGAAPKLTSLSIRGESEEAKQELLQAREGLKVE